MGNDNDDDDDEDEDEDENEVCKYGRTTDSKNDTQQYFTLL